MTDTPNPQPPTVMYRIVQFSGSVDGICGWKTGAGWSRACGAPAVSRACGAPAVSRAIFHSPDDIYPDGVYLYACGEHRRDLASSARSREVELEAVPESE
jgi:hypothetical protein